MPHTTNINTDWQFHEGDAPELRQQARRGRAVTLPHNAVDLPYNHADQTAYQRRYTYQKLIRPDPAWDGQEVTLRFDAVMADARIYLNGTEIAAHKDGYTPIHARLTDRLRPGDNLLTVVLDGTENPEIPPFGGQIDYLTYAGIYRDAWIEVAPALSIAGAKVETPDVLAAEKTVHAVVTLANACDQEIEGRITAELIDRGGRTVATATVPVSEARVAIDLAGLKDIALWDVKDPALYTLSLVLETAHGRDGWSTQFGFRSVDFTTDGFRLNGKPLKIRGLNRHQSFPHVGYALPRAAQERDAEIVRYELGCNTVRSSHYPPSPWFLDHCDRIGLLVLEEIPGWQHIGGSVWKAESVRNVERMIRRDWNHPSVIMWGVRINESPDDHAFYAKTNRVARALDTTRPTGGIRCIAESEFLEDVYTMNDFVLGSHELGGNRCRTPLRPQREVTGLGHDVPYLVTEYNGHMFPTKSTDNELRQNEHVLRHLEVMDAAYGDSAVAGCIGWCAFDYNTHADFGSGDGICYHGVMDMYREPKFAAYAYASQTEPSERVVMEPVTHYARGERNIGGIFPLIVLTNCDEVEIRYAGTAPRRIKPDREAFPDLPHPPVIIDRKHFTDAELGEWGERWETTALTGYLDGAAVAECLLPERKIPSALEIAPDWTAMAPKGDCLRVMVRALDQAGRKLPYFSEPIEVEVSGAARRLGPALLAMQGGSVGFWIESSGREGPVELQITSQRFGRQSVGLLSKEDAG